MPRYIDAKELKNGVMTAMIDESSKDGDLPIRIGMLFCHFVDDTPAADVQEVKHGHWNVTIRLSNESTSVIGDCSVCGYRGGMRRWNFCPNCGAKMDEEDKYVKIH